MSCNKSDNILSPQASENLNSIDPNSPDGISGIISTVKGKKGFNNGNKSWDNYGSYLASNIGNVYYDTITGNGLGTSGSIQFEIPNNSGYSPTYDYTFQSISWSDTRIIFKITPVSTYSFPETGRLKVVSNTGVSYSTVSIVPYIYDKQYGQANWWVMKRTVESGFSPSNAEYQNITTSVDPNHFTPAEHSLLSWGNGVHMAYIEGVNYFYESGNVIVYYIDISESNVTYTRDYTTIKVKVHLNGGGTKFLVSGYDRYYSQYPHSSALFAKAQ